MIEFIKELNRLIDHDNIVTDELLRYAFSTDASLYRMIPEIVVFVHNENEVKHVLDLANKYKKAITFRTAGTSLSGQAVTDKILVILSNASWRNYEILEDGHKILLEPGIIGAEANNHLSPYKRKIGPDPGSINTAKIGGIIANNSSGMCCGINQNSYSTIDSIRAVLANGEILDSSDQSSIDEFKRRNSLLIDQIMQIHKQISGNPTLVKFIKKKFAIKNTSGYSLNAFIDFNDPIKIIERLLIGSEGTLGFISKVTLSTVIDEKYKSLNLLYGKMNELCDLTVKIAKYDISSIELLDAISIKSVSHIKELSPYIIEIDDHSAAIMIEITGNSQEALDRKLNQITKEIDRTPLIYQTGFTQDKQISDIIWQARKGILPTIAGQRPIGSSVLIEDVAVEVEQLPALINELKFIFKNYGYENAAIFGHVLSGNIHFVLTPNFANESERTNYEKFMTHFTDLIANKYHGSLKAEHGSGRNISPFAKLEWGEECWNIMWQIKESFDPNNILNPDVKLTHDNTLHMRHLKELPAINEQIDQCMECGFCEPVCPSRKLSLTPRQRNSVMRKISTIENKKVRKKWQKKFAHYGVETCATTGMCSIACPVGIDTGEYMLSLTKNNNQRVRHNEFINLNRQKLKRANSLGKIIGKSTLHAFSERLHSTFKSIPIYLENMPQVQQHKFRNTPSMTPGGIMLLPACPNRIFASSSGAKLYPSQILLERMGYKVRYPENWQDQCCGQVYHSQHNNKQEDISLKRLQKLEEKSSILILDNSSCATFAHKSGLSTESIDNFICERIIKNRIVRRYDKIAVHFDCSTTKSGKQNQLLELLKLCSYEVVVTNEIKCCGFAGDKGFTMPELNASSLEDIKSKLNDCQVGVTFNRSCQIGLELHSGIEFISFVELILACYKE